MDYQGSDAAVDGPLTYNTSLESLPGGRFKATTTLGGTKFEAVATTERLAQISLEQKLEHARLRGKVR